MIDINYCYNYFASLAKHHTFKSHKKYMDNFHNHKYDVASD